MSRWTHAICNNCWRIKCMIEEGQEREPVRMVEECREREPCCWCNEEHSSGIYIRSDPIYRLWCHNGRDHEDE